MTTGFIVGAVLVAVALVVGFVWLNRNKPEVVDQAEEKVRNFKKKK